MVNTILHSSAIQSLLGSVKILEWGSLSQLTISVLGLEFTKLLVIWLKIIKLYRIIIMLKPESSELKIRDQKRFKEIKHQAQEHINLRVTLDI
jgi:hypothetical protein